MAKFFAYKYSTSHLFFPKIIITLLIDLGLIIAVPKVLAALRSGKRLAVPRFFVEGYDKLKFWGTLALMAVYVLALQHLGFLPASLACIFLFNVLFCGTLQWRSLLTSAVISVTASLFVWYVFGVLFNITLP